jgi:hypothetical protein
VGKQGKKKRQQQGPHPGAPHRSGGPFGVWITDGHEAEAEEEEMEKPPSKFGTWFLRRLGYKGTVEVKPPPPPHAHRPSHEHRHVSEPPAEH